MTLIEFAESVLKSAKNPMTFSEIWQKGIELGFDKEVKSKGKTPAVSMQARIYVDMKENDSRFYIASRQPTRFWLKARQNELNSANLNDEILLNEARIAQKDNFNERDLHALLVKFLFESDKFDLYCKTIFHEKSQKSEKGRDKWNYPDIVGIHFPFDDYSKETLDLLKNLNIPNYKIYSFELKKSISWGDLKEYYFQAVSNSSWANEGYLVVFEDINDEIFSELVRLNASFGIGVIQLELNILDSRILLPAKQRSLDTQTLNMLTEKNSNFRDFIDDVNKDIKANDKFRVAKDRYDKILSDDELESHIKKHKITKCP